MKNVIVITGAWSGFGALAARALAKAGHTVYASMRDTAGRNALRALRGISFSPRLLLFTERFLNGERYCEVVQRSEGLRIYHP